jgi:uncharacterized membrane protein
MAVQSRLALFILACLIVLAAAFLRIWHIQSESLEPDELFSRRVAMSSPPVAFEMIRQDLMHPPLYYFALKSTLPLTGTSSTGIRTLSLACGIASVAILLLWGVAVPSLRAAAFLAAALLALNGTHIFYSQQARSYPLFGLEIDLLILWALVLDRHSQRRWYWAIGALLMILTVYTHYVGALFIAAIVLATVVSQNVPRATKIRIFIASSVAALAFLPWLISEIAVYKAKHGLGNNIGWQGLPTGYDLRSIWSDYIGLPNIHGGGILAFSVGLILAVCAIVGLKNRLALLLVATSILPPLVLYAASFKPLNMTVFGERHLLPCIFASLALVAIGLGKLASSFPKPALVWGCGVLCLCSLQWAQSSRLLANSIREPYPVIANELKHDIPAGEPVYTTWPYGIGETVNFYLGADRVQPLPKTLPKEFVVLYRPAISKEQSDINSLLSHSPAASLNHCQYYSALASTFGTRLCVVENPH